MYLFSLTDREVAPGLETKITSVFTYAPKCNEIKICTHSLGIGTHKAKIKSKI